MSAPGGISVGRLGPDHARKRVWVHMLRGLEYRTAGIDRPVGYGAVGLGVDDEWVFARSDGKAFVMNRAELDDLCTRLLGAGSGSTAPPRLASDWNELHGAFGTPPVPTHLADLPVLLEGLRLIRTEFTDENPDWRLSMSDFVALSQFLSTALSDSERVVVSER